MPQKMTNTVLKVCGPFLLAFWREKFCWKSFTCYFAKCDPGELWKVFESENLDKLSLCCASDICGTFGATPPPPNKKSFGWLQTPTPARPHPLLPTALPHSPTTRVLGMSLTKETFQIWNFNSNSGFPNETRNQGFLAVPSLSYIV